MLKAVKTRLPEGATVDRLEGGKQQGVFFHLVSSIDDGVGIWNIESTKDSWEGGEAAEFLLK